MENPEDMEMSDSDDSSSDEDDEILLQEHLKHYIRMEVEREVLSKLEQLNVHMEDNSQIEEDKQVEEEQPVTNSVCDIRVSILSSQQSEVQQSNPIFSKIKSFFKKKN